MRRTVLLIAGLVAAAGTTTVVVVASAGSGSTAPATTTARELTIGGMRAGGLTRDALAAALRAAQAQAPVRTTVLLGRRSPTVAVADLGIVVDVPATVKRALEASSERKGSGTDVVPALSVDDAVLDLAVAALQRAAGVPAREADVTYAGGRLQGTAPAAGQAGDASDIREAVLAGARRLPFPARLPAPVRILRSHTRLSDLDPVLARGNYLLAHPPVLIAANRRTILEPGLLGPELTTESGTGSGPKLELALRPATPSALTGVLVQRLSTPATEPRLEAPAPKPVLREQGSVTWRPQRSAVSFLTGGSPGQQVLADDVQRAVRDMLSDDAATTTTVRASDLLPHSSDAAARTVNAVLGTFTTPFACCQPRVHNITRMAETVDGTLIGPGQTFSLNGIVGKRTRAKGYVEAPFILDGELSTDIGGGVSQFATTTLNAAYFAGLQINQHQAHSFYISRYPPGREATVNYPTIDLRWTNTSGAPVLVRAKALATSLTVTLYGRDDGRVVRSVSGPRKSVPNKDFRITVTRFTSIPGRPPDRYAMTTTYNKPPKGE